MKLDNNILGLLNMPEIRTFISKKEDFFLKTNEKGSS